MVAIVLSSNEWMKFSLFCLPTPVVLFFRQMNKHFLREKVEKERELGACRKVITDMARHHFYHILFSKILKTKLHEG